MIATSEKAHEIAANGAFTRQKNRFDTPFGDGGGRDAAGIGQVAEQPGVERHSLSTRQKTAKEGGFLPVEAGRYRLIAAAVCPWAHRQLIALRLLGLSEGQNPPISVGLVNPVRTECGWAFDGGTDAVLGIRFLSEAYLKADPSYEGRATVPAIIDTRTGAVVNNDYHRLSNYWETVWKPFHKPNAPDLYPKDLRGEIDALNLEIFERLNNGVYRAGFAESQAAYETAYDDVFAELDALEARFGDGRRFLFGDALTDSDIRLYVTLARFDIAYNTAFRCNRNRLIDFPHLWRYARELYAIPAFGETTDFDGIKRGYHLGNAVRNPYGILPLGPDVSIWEQKCEQKEERL